MVIILRRGEGLQRPTKDGVPVLQVEQGLARHGVRDGRESGVLYAQAKDVGTGET